MRAKPVARMFSETIGSDRELTNRGQFERYGERAVEYKVGFRAKEQLLSDRCTSKVDLEASECTIPLRFTVSSSFKCNFKKNSDGHEFDRITDVYRHGHWCINRDENNNHIRLEFNIATRA